MKQNDLGYPQSDLLRKLSYIFFCEFYFECNPLYIQITIRLQKLGAVEEKTRPKVCSSKLNYKKLLFSNIMDAHTKIIFFLCVHP